MNQAELTAAVAERAGLTKADAGKAVEALVGTITEALQQGDEIRIAGLTDWTVQEIGATSDLRAQVQAALDQAYDDFYSGRLPPVPEDTSSAS